MNLAIFDAVECVCGCHEFKLENLVTTQVDHPSPVTEVLCENFCAYKQCAISTGNVSPLNCFECRRREILEGTIRCTCGREWPISNGSPQFATDASPRFAKDGLRAVEIDWRTDPRLRTFVAAHPEGTIYQHPSWLQILTKEYRQQCVMFACEDANGKLHALLPLIYTRGLPSILGGTRTARRLSSLPRTPIAGSLSIGGRAAAILMRAVLDRVKRDPGLQLELKTQADESDGVMKELARIPWRSSYVLDLPADPEQLQMGNSHKRRHRIRWAVKKAISSGVKVRFAESEDELEEWYELYLDTMRRKVVPPRSYRLFHAMWHELRPRSRMQLLLAEKQEAGRTRLLAGSIFLKFGTTVFYAFTGCRREDFSMHPHDLIQWQAIQTASKEGYRHYDFGEVADDSQSLANFKSKWGAEEKRLYRYYYPAPKNLAPESLPLTAWPRELAHNVWRHLPLSATACIGDILYSYL